MLFLFIISLFLFRIWKLVPKLLEGYWVHYPRYLKQVIRWVSFLLPMSLLSNAILGLVGAGVQLALAIVGYQECSTISSSVIYPLIKEVASRKGLAGFPWSKAFGVFRVMVGYGVKHC